MATRGALGDGPDQKEMEQERGPTTYSLGPVEMSPCVGYARLIKLRIWAWTEDGTTTKVLTRDAGMEGDLTTDTEVREGTRVLAFVGEGASRAKGRRQPVEARRERGSPLEPPEGTRPS